MAPFRIQIQILQGSPSVPSVRRTENLVFGLRLLRIDLLAVYYSR